MYLCNKFRSSAITDKQSTSLNITFEHLSLRRVCKYLLDIGENKAHQNYH